jgi:hypothetical protein
MYVADYFNYRVQLFLAGESSGSTIAGVTGVLGSNSSLFASPFSVALGSPLNMYVADFYNQRVQKFVRYGNKSFQGRLSPDLHQTIFLWRLKLPEAESAESSFIFYVFCTRSDATCTLVSLKYCQRNRQKKTSIILPFMLGCVTYRIYLHRRK